MARTHHTAAWVDRSHAANHQPLPPHVLVPGHNPPIAVPLDQPYLPAPASPYGPAGLGAPYPGFHPQIWYNLAPMMPPGHLMATPPPGHWPGMHPGARRGRGAQHPRQHPRQHFKDGPRPQQRNAHTDGAAAGAPHCRRLNPGHHVGRAGRQAGAQQMHVRADRGGGNIRQPIPAPHAQARHQQQAPAPRRQGPQHAAEHAPAVQPPPAMRLQAAQGAPAAAQPAVCPAEPATQVAVPQEAPAAQPQGPAAAEELVAAAQADDSVAGQPEAPVAPQDASAVVVDLNALFSQDASPDATESQVPPTHDPLSAAGDARGTLDPPAVQERAHRASSGAQHPRPNAGARPPAPLPAPHGRRAPRASRCRRRAAQPSGPQPPRQHHVRNDHPSLVQHDQRRAQAQHYRQRCTRAVHPVASQTPQQEDPVLLAAAHPPGAAPAMGCISSPAVPGAPMGLHVPLLPNEPVHDVMRFHKAVAGLFKPFACAADCAGGHEGLGRRAGGLAGGCSSMRTPAAGTAEGPTVFSASRPRTDDPDHTDECHQMAAATSEEPAAQEAVPCPPHPAVPDNLRCHVPECGGDGGPTLADVWQAFNAASTLNLEVPCLGTGLGETLAFFTPYLSAMQITAASDVSAPCTPSAEALTPSSPAASQNTADSVEDAADVLESPVAPSARSVGVESAGLVSATASPTHVNGDSVTSSPVGPSVKVPCDGVADDAANADLPIVFRPDGPIAGACGCRHNAQRLVANWTAGIPVWERPPLLQQVWRLVASQPSAALPRPVALLNMPLRSIHPSSWFAVAWHPTYRIPEAPLTAKFITYHSFADFAAARALGAAAAGLKLEALTLDVAEEEEAGGWLDVSQPAGDESGSCREEDAEMRRAMANMVKLAGAFSQSRMALETQGGDLLHLKFSHTDFSNVFAEEAGGGPASATAGAAGGM